MEEWHNWYLYNNVVILLCHSELNYYINFKISKYMVLYDKDVLFKKIKRL